MSAIANAFDTVQVVAAFYARPTCHCIDMHFPVIITSWFPISAVMPSVPILMSLLSELIRLSLHFDSPRCLSSRISWLELNNDSILLYLGMIPSIFVTKILTFAPLAPPVPAPLQNFYGFLSGCFYQHSTSLWPGFPQWLQFPLNLYFPLVFPPFPFFPYICCFIYGHVFFMCPDMPQL